MPKNPNTLPIDQLQPNPFQPRAKIQTKDIQELAESIRVHGIIEPLVVAKTPAGYQIIAGERRWRAAKEAGLEEVPVHIRKTSPKQMLELALVENVQREDLNPLERAQGFQRLIQEFGLGQPDIAERIGKTQSFVSNSLRLLDLPDVIKDGLIEEKITEGHAKAIAGILIKEKMIEVYHQIVKEEASVRRAEQLARKVKRGYAPKTDKPQPPKIAPYDEEIKQLEEKLKDAFNNPMDFRLSRSRTSTRLTIILHGDEDKTDDDIRKVLKTLEQTK